MSECTEMDATNMPTKIYFLCNIYCYGEYTSKLKAFGNEHMANR